MLHLPEPFLKKETRKAVHFEDHSVLPLTCGRVALIDREDAPELEKRNWAAHRFNGKWYASAYVRLGPKAYTRVLMHRVVMGADDPSVEVDHKEGDGLDNRKSMLRLATRSQNRANKGVGPHNKLGIKGVYMAKGRYYAVVTVESQGIHLGCFDTALEASAAYDAAALAHFGEFARLNNLS